MIETPARRSTRRKSQFPETDGDSSSAAESEAVAKPVNNTRRRVPKFIEHIDEAAESDAPSEYSPVSATAPDLSNGDEMARRKAWPTGVAAADDVKIKTEVTTAVALTAPKHEESNGIKAEETEEKKPVTKAPAGKKRKAGADGVLHAAQSTETRRMSKRLRR